MCNGEGALVIQRTMAAQHMRTSYRCSGSRFASTIQCCDSLRFASGAEGKLADKVVLNVE